MHYSIKLTELENGLSLFIPNPEQVKSTYEQLLKNNALTPFPFWAKLWASSKALTIFLNERPTLIKGKVVLEIGAGIGQPSFTIEPFCKKIIISDHNKDAVELINYNIDQRNCTNAVAMCIDWNEFPGNISAEVILLSDINYAPDQFEILLKLIQRFINNGSTIIIATPQRIMASPFIERLQNNILESHTSSVIEKNTTVAISIYVLGK